MMRATEPSPCKLSDAKQNGAGHAPDACSAGGTGGQGFLGAQTGFMVLLNRGHARQAILKKGFDASQALENIGLKVIHICFGLINKPEMIEFTRG